MKHVFLKGEFVALLKWKSKKNPYLFIFWINLKANLIIASKWCAMEWAVSTASKPASYFKYLSEQRDGNVDPWECLPISASLI